MTHKRQLIREAIRGRLETIPALSGRCYSTRSKPTAMNELPAAIVYTLSETSEQISTCRTLMRTLTAAIEVRASATGALDNALDNLSEAIEQALAQDPRLGKRAVNSELTGTIVGLDGEGETRQAVATLTYSVKYQTDGNGN